MRLTAALVALVLGALGVDAPRAAADGPARVVSLAPSITEIVYALGAGDRLVGVCGGCDHPAAVARVPRVGSYLSPSVETVIGTRADLVIAVPSPGNREAVRAVERAGIRVLVVQDRTLANLWASIQAIADALGIAEEGRRLVKEVTGRLDQVRAWVDPRRRRRVLVIVGHNPLIVVGGGTLQDELVTLAGGTNVAADAGSVWPKITRELVVARAPEVIIDAAMGDERGARTLFADLTTVPAVANDRIVVLRTDAFLRAGPRVSEAAGALLRAIHPEVSAEVSPE